MKKMRRNEAFTAQAAQIMTDFVLVDDPVYQSLKASAEKECEESGKVEYEDTKRSAEF